MINDEWVAIGYLFSAALFIFGLKNLSHPRTAPRGNQLGAMGMLVAVLTTILQMELGEGIVGWTLIGGGLLLGGVIGWIMAVRVDEGPSNDTLAEFHLKDGCQDGNKHSHRTELVATWCCARM
jgi:NAD(P) transhydrogenase subunit beta